MIRLATGDLSAVMTGRSPCGRSNMRIAGWMGRADQTTKVKGMFVHPGAGGGDRQAPPRARPRCASSSRAANEQDVMTLCAEFAEAQELPRSTTLPCSKARHAACRRPAHRAGRDGASRDQAARRVSFVAPGALPNDGKVIADERKTVVMRKRWDERFQYGR